MNLIYVYIGGSRRETSVQQKVVCQIRELNKSGINTRGFFYSNDVLVEEELDEYITLKPLPKYSKKHILFESRFKNSFDTKHIHSDLRKYDFDRLFIRFHGSSISMFKMLNCFASKTYLYIPSNIISEPFQERKHNKYYSFLSWLIKWIDYFIFSFVFNYILYLFILPKLKGTVVFTPEFAKMIERKTLYRAKIIYNRDGVDIEKVKLRKYKPSDDVYKLVFLKGSAVQQPWAGLDRLIKSINARPDLKFELYITGKIYDEENFNFPFVKLTGRLTNNELEELIDNVDIGVSNLANYMIGFNETTNLKSRDYFARGLPFIQANTMPDVDEYEIKKYYLYIDNNDSLIDMNKVKDFIDRIRVDSNHPEIMREFAQQKLDWSITVNELAKNLNEL